MHVATPPGGTGHTVQAAPHAVGSVFAGHLPPHAWNEGLHVAPHTAPAQVAVAFATTGHLMLHPPQLSTLVFGSTHVFPQSTGMSGVHPFVQPNVVPVAAHSGVAAAQIALHAPQVSGFERSVSQPSDAAALQFA